MMPLLAIAAVGWAPKVATNVLPPGWHNIGRTVKLDASSEFGGRLASELQAGQQVWIECIDEDGSVVYGAEGVGVDTRTGNTKTIEAYHPPDSGGHPVVKLRWKSQTPSDAPGNPFIDSIYYCHGNKFFLSMSGPGGPWGAAIATVGGPAARVVTFRDRARGARFPGFEAQLQGDGGILRVTKGKKIVAAKLPPGLVQVALFTNNGLWHKGRIYGRGFGPQFNGLVAITFNGSRPTFTKYVLPPELHLQHAWSALGSEVLADDNICSSLCVDSWRAVMPPEPWKYATLVFDTKHNKWKVYGGLTYYGASYNGRYVAYGWDAEPVMHIARVGT
jgi:hypothetical protein